MRNSLPRSRSWRSCSLIWSKISNRKSINVITWTFHFKSSLPNAPPSVNHSPILNESSLRPMNTTRPWEPRCLVTSQLLSVTKNAWIVRSWTSTNSEPTLRKLVKILPTRPTTSTNSLTRSRHSRNRTETSTTSYRRSVMRTKSFRVTLKSINLKIRNSIQIISKKKTT